MTIFMQNALLFHAESAEYAEAYRTKLRRIAIHKILRILRAPKKLFHHNLPRGTAQFHEI